MSFKIGDKVKLVSQENNVRAPIGSTGIVTFVTAVEYLVKFDCDPSTTWSCSAKQLELISNAKIEFKVGDIVGSTRSLDKTVRYIVERIYDGSMWIRVVDQVSMYIVHSEQISTLYLAEPMDFREKTNDVCQHNWKIYQGLRFDDGEYCTKCPAIRKSIS